MITVDKFDPRSRWGFAPKPGQKAMYRAHVAGAFAATADSRKEAEAACKERIERQARAFGSDDRTYIFCNDGTLLAVYYADAWVYDIAGPGRSRSQTVCGDSYAETAQAALAHAEQSYGGVRSIG